MAASPVAMHSRRTFLRNILCEVGASLRRTALIIDDEPIWGQSLSRILDEADFEVIGNERTMASALPAIEDCQPDLVVTEMAGLELLAPLRAARPDMRIVVLSHVREHDAIERALAAGVNVYVFKTSHPGDIVSALRQAFEATFILRNSFAGLPRKAADDGVVQERIREAVAAALAAGRLDRGLQRREQVGGLLLRLGLLEHDLLALALGLDDLAERVAVGVLVLVGLEVA